MSPKLVVTDSDFPDLELERRLAADAGVAFDAAQATTPDEVVAAAGDADALLVQYASITDDVFDALDLSAVGRYGIGVDSIDLDAARDHGVTVVNVPDYCLDEVSTHALALLLACERRVSKFDALVKSGTWDWSAGKPIRRLRGRTLGLVGFGRIPRLLVEKARPLGVDVLTYDPYVDAEGPADHGVEKVSWEDLLARSDAISIHAPLTEKTRGLFDADAFRRMRDDAVLVNTARGAVVDIDDLHDAIVEGEIAGAGIDVMPDEPVTESPLFELDSVVLTPHVAWYSEESYVELRRRVTEDVLRVVAGDAPENPVVAPE